MHVLYYVSLALPLPHEHARAHACMYMCITPISGTRALILSRRGNQPYSEEINSTRGLLSNVGDNRKWDGGVVGGAAGGGRTTFDLANNSLIPGVTHVSIQKTPPHPRSHHHHHYCLPLCYERVARPRVCVFSSYLLSFKCLWLKMCAVFFSFRRRPSCSCVPPVSFARASIQSTQFIWLTRLWVMRKKIHKKSYKL